MADLKDKVVIVTGSSSGIGAETAVRFAECGAKVVITGRNQAGINETVDRCKQAGATDQQLLTVAGDLLNRDVITTIIQTTLSAFGDIHVLVNNAGGLICGHFDRTTTDDVVDMLNINLVAVFNVTKEAMPHLVKTKGCVVNVSSLCGPQPMPSIFPCSISKAAQDQFTKMLAVEMAPKGVRVNSVNPGHTVSPLFTRPDGGPVAPDDADQFFQTTAACYPLGRCGQPPDVAAAILFLASDQSSYMTGVLLPVDGGRHATIRGEH